jgi:hypothetical protein
MKKQTNIKPVTGIGVKGYQVTFSILDLYKMKQLAMELYEINQKASDFHGDFKGQNSSLTIAYELFSELFNKTIGETEGGWDFLSDKEEGE